jgi:N-acetylglucosaminyl-diphospho-decaprenol L-rhamnosyltransferase
VTDADVTLDPGVITLVTVLYNSSDELERFADSARAAAPGHELDIVAVDNDSPDGARSAGIAERIGVSFIAAPSNRGYGAGVNLGVRSSQRLGELLVVVNPDVEFTDAALAKLVETAARSDPSVVAFGPRILRTDGTVYPSARRSPSLSTGVGHALLGWLPDNPWSRRYRAENESSDHARDADWLSGSCLVIRTEWFLRIGGFDERYFMYFEDVDLGERIRKHGGRNRFVPEATVVHAGGLSTATRREAMVRAHHDSAARFIDTKYPGVLGWPVRAIVRVGLAVRRTWLVRRARRSRA